MTANEGELSLTIRLSIEPLIAGVDLNGLFDTNESDRASEVDRLRGMTAEMLKAEIEAFWPELSAKVLVLGQAQLDLRLASVLIEDQPNLSLARDTIVEARAWLDGDTVQFSWAPEFGDIVLRFDGEAGSYTGYLAAGEQSPVIDLGEGVRLTALAAFLDYIPVGFDHIVPKGLDHILFVLGLFFLSLRMGALLWQVSAFTLAHTVTLALGASGLVSIPASIVEPLIAASITYVAVENIVIGKLMRWRPAVVFCFGLLHGLGFAGVLQEFGLPQSQFVAGLLGFNIGVELGQLFVIGIAFLLVGMWFGRKPWYRSFISVPASGAIAAVGAWWFIERTFL